MLEASKRWLLPGDPLYRMENHQSLTVLDILRNKGGRVSVHNDYMEDGCLYTFWQMTFPLGPKDLAGEPTLIALVGEGEDDYTALEHIIHKYNGIIAQQVLSRDVDPPEGVTREQLREQTESVLKQWGIVPKDPECPHCAAGIPLEGEYHHDTSARGRGWEPADEYRICEKEPVPPKPAPQDKVASQGSPVVNPCPKCGVALRSSVAGNYCPNDSCDYTE
jgi:hypothetical protein